MREWETGARVISYRHWAQCRADEENATQVLRQEPLDALRQLSPIQKASTSLLKCKPSIFHHCAVNY